MKLCCRVGSFKMESPHLGTVIHHLSKTHKIFFPPAHSEGFFPPFMWSSFIWQGLRLYSFIHSLHFASRQSGFNAAPLKKTNDRLLPQFSSNACFSTVGRRWNTWREPKEKGPAYNLLAARRHCQPRLWPWTFVVLLQTAFQIHIH